MIEISSYLKVNRYVFLLFVSSRVIELIHFSGRSTCSWLTPRTLFTEKLFHLIYIFLMYWITYFWIYLSNSELNNEKILTIKQDYVMFALKVFFSWFEYSDYNFSSSLLQVHVFYFNFCRTTCPLLEINFETMSIFNYLETFIGPSHCF